MLGVAISIAITLVTLLVPLQSLNLGLRVLLIAVLVNQVVESGIPPFIGLDDGPLQPVVSGRNARGLNLDVLEHQEVKVHSG